MKLYYSPLACSLADHIALEEVGLSFERERVNLKTKRTESGRDFNEITSKGYVPALILDNGETLTENIAILDWIASQYPALSVPGPLGRTRLLETLTYLSTELHRSFKSMLHANGDAERASAAATIGGHLSFLSNQFKGDFLFGSTPTVADFYLFVMLLWAEHFDLAVPSPLAMFRDLLKSRPAVQRAMRAEGLHQKEDA
ncbi:glutathione S-transferase C-terminal domain-containing protein [Phyllobacterium lublinensis]|jgi:glutathione S-transferase|uniref:glutathione S-transferase C-terminal domain-containing protein n=1 Tax=Phyllobacterium lublinensis TaxID=2875708 RepID=UPI001CCDA625|nr:glutathione S-transferase C-terminal domain-containing protein [Phyllobacterium sp. 2063]MBZ9656230.1 glutathione S-transferase C-terminal domain-containing protein [Phyllobacterium sp. 2063]